MNTSEKGKQLIKTLEGCKLVAYQCSNKKWTIGYGNTYYENGKPVKEGDTITQERAETLFDKVLVNYEIALKQQVRIKLNQNQFDALVSFFYNIGATALKGSNTINLLNQNCIYEFLLMHKRWVHDSNGEVIDGLKKRRIEEQKLFLKFPLAI